MRSLSLRALLFYIIVAVSMLFLPFHVRAEPSPGPVFFNEIMWRGSTVSTADEWIELYNNSIEIIDLAGWVVYDEVKDIEMVKIEKGQIAPGSFFLISNNDKDHQFSGGESVLDIVPDVVESSVSLSNSKFSLSLRDAGNNVVDKVGNSQSPFFSKSGLKASLERSVYEDGTLIENWTEAILVENLDEPDCDDLTDCETSIANPHNSGAPKIITASLSNDVFIVGSLNLYTINYEIEDSGGDLADVYIEVSNKGISVDRQFLSAPGDKINLKYDFCPEIKLVSIDQTRLRDELTFDIGCAYLNSNIIINEVMPHPVGKDWDGDGKQSSSDEWIELYNNSKTKIDLTGWKIRDESGKMFELDGCFINAKSYLVLYKSTSKLSLNDDGDRLFLIDPRGEKVSKVIIPASSKYENLSYGLIDAVWQWSVEVTPGNKNIFKSAEEGVIIEKEPDTAIANNGQKSLSVVQTQSDPTVTRVIVTTTTTKTVRKATGATLASSKIKPLVLGASTVRGPIHKGFIRIEYLLYFFGFTAFILMVLFYEFCRRE